MQKAAIVIGVNKTGDLPVLSAAASGASKVAGWLAREGFHVEKFLDTRRPVAAGDIFAAVAKLVDQGTLEQLVIYFSGHGFLSSASEHWMLSGAPGNPNEAISLAESALLSRECGIPSVVFISDACRSTPQSLRAERVRGSLIFPNQGVSAGSGIDAEVDRFFATLPGEPALEMTLAESAGQYEGIYTACFLDAFRHPDEDMIRSVTLDGTTMQVVPNRSLKGYLKREVNQMAQAKSIKLRQLPRSIIESGDACYLGRVAKRRLGGTPRGAQPKAKAVVSLSDVARFELSGANAAGAAAAGIDTQTIQEAAVSTGFGASVELVGRADAPGQLRDGNRCLCHWGRSGLGPRCRHRCRVADLRRGDLDRPDPASPRAAAGGQPDTPVRRRQRNRARSRQRLHRERGRRRRACRERQLRAVGQQLPLARLSAAAPAARSTARHGRGRGPFRGVPGGAGPSERRGRRDSVHEEHRPDPGALCRLCILGCWAARSDPLGSGLYAGRPARRPIRYRDAGGHPVWRASGTSGRPLLPHAQPGLGPAAGEGRATCPKPCRKLPITYDPPCGRRSNPPGWISSKRRFTRGI